MDFWRGARGGSFPHLPLFRMVWGPLPFEGFTTANPNPNSLHQFDCLGPVTVDIKVPCQAQSKPALPSHLRPSSSHGSPHILLRVAREKMAPHQLSTKTLQHKHQTSTLPGSSDVSTANVRMRHHAGDGRRAADRPQGQSERADHELRRASAHLHGQG